MSRLSQDQSFNNPGHLKIYRGPEESNQGSAVPAVEMSDDNHSVTVPAGVVVPLLADALLSQRTWLRDFEEDEITLSADLYEVLMAYQHFRRPVA